MKENNLQVLVLAAGQGKRMNVGDLPKVLVQLKGKSILRYLIEAIKKSGVDNKPTVVIGKGTKKIKEEFNNEVNYVLQDVQLGTGHAVMKSMDALDQASDVMVLYGDHPLVSPELIKRLADTHLSSGAVLTMTTLTVPNYNDWRSEFKSFGKIVRNSEGEVIKITEVKDATPEELEINELNVGYYCFKADWLWGNITKLSKNNAQGELYLTDLVGMADKDRIKTISVENLQEALGVNTSEQLETIEKLL